MGQKKSKKSVGTSICSNDGDALSPRGEENDENNQTFDKVKKSLDSASTGSNNSANYSPPRGLKDILASESKTREFETFLSGIDEENEDEVMVTRLRFVMMCRNLHQELKSIDTNVLATDLSKNPPEENDAIKNRTKEAANEMQNSFFHQNNPSKRVALENSVLRERCHSVLNEAANATNVTDEMKQDIIQIIVIKAQLDAIKTIEPVHQEFLKRRQRRKNNSACGVNNASSMGKEVLRRLENCIL